MLTPPRDRLAGHRIGEETPAAQWPVAFPGGGEYLPGPGPLLAGLGQRDAVAAAIARLEQAGAGHAARSYRLRDLWRSMTDEQTGEPRVSDPALDDGTPTRGPMRSPGWSPGTPTTRVTQPRRLRDDWSSFLKE